MKVNGEALYGTRPWKVFGEGPTQGSGGHFKEKEIVYTPEDMRFAVKGDTLFAYLLAWPADGQVTVTSLATGKEAVLAYLATDAAHPPLTLLLVAAVGNTLGGMTSWGIGWLLARKYSVRGLLKPEQQQAIDRLQRWGSPALLLSWLPLIGDPLCVAAGWLRIHWLLSLLFIGMGKTARYVVILYLIN